MGILPKVTANHEEVPKGYIAQSSFNELNENNEAYTLANDVLDQIKCLIYEGMTINSLEKNLPHIFEILDVCEESRQEGHPILQTPRTIFELEFFSVIASLITSEDVLDMHAAAHLYVQYAENLSENFHKERGNIVVSLIEYWNLIDRKQLQLDSKNDAFRFWHNFWSGEQVLPLKKNTVFQDTIITVDQLLQKNIKYKSQVA